VRVRRPLYELGGLGRIWWTKRGLEDTYSQLVDWLDGRPNLAKVRVAGSNPVFRSKYNRRSGTLSRVPDCFVRWVRSTALLYFRVNLVERKGP
jgi:hypothetical protein